MISDKARRQTEKKRICGLCTVSKMHLSDSPAGIHSVRHMLLSVYTHLYAALWTQEPSMCCSTLEKKYQLQLQQDLCSFFSYKNINTTRLPFNSTSRVHTHTHSREASKKWISWCKSVLAHYTHRIPLFLEDMSQIYAALRARLGMSDLIT